jgi:hypothetical protein
MIAIGGLDAWRTTVAYLGCVPITAHCIPEPCQWPQTVIAYVAAIQSGQLAAEWY